MKFAMGVKKMSFDRAIGKALEGFPRIHSLLKKAYLRSRFLFAKRPGEMASVPAESVFDGFFGYYDKTPWSMDGRFYLYHSILDNGLLGIEVADLCEDKVTRMDVTSAWSPQQGAMLQWLPNSKKIVFNTIHSNSLCSKVVSIEDGTSSICPFPVQTVHPEGGSFLSLNYRRLYKIRPEYGYSMVVENFSPLQAESGDGIWHVDLESGASKLILSIAALKNFEPRSEMNGASHKVNHIIYSPSGKRFVFMHRWLGKKGKFSRLYVASSPNASDLKLLMDERMVSHYSWRDDDHLIVYGRTLVNGDCYYLVNVASGNIEPIGKGVLNRWGDGHPTFSPDRRWIITDTYPDKRRMRRLLLWDTLKEELQEVGSFFAPWKFDGVARVDLHPRWSPDGTMISIDSAHEGKVRTYVFSLNKLMDSG